VVKVQHAPGEYGPQISAIEGHWMKVTLPSTRCTSSEPVRASDQASDLSPDNVLQHLAVQRQIGHDLLQPAVLALELLQPFHLRRQQARILLLPVEVGRLAEAGVAAALSYPCAFFALLDDECVSRPSENFDMVMCFRFSPSRETVAKNSNFK
jgi:hypothetical protein